MTGLFHMPKVLRNLKFEGEGFDASDPISNFKYLWLGFRGSTIS
jgi:hypothetical protein